MAHITIKLRPGVNTQYSAILAEAQVVISQLIRWRDGLLQKVGGWMAAAVTTFLGVCRGMHSWEQLNGLLDMGIGTHLKLFLFQGGAYFDLTPVRASGTLGNNPFTTTNTSNLVSVASTAHGLSVNDFVELAGATTFNNVTMNGEFQVVSVTDANNYVIQSATVANASGAGGGNAVTFSYLLPVGLKDTAFVASTGFGAGGFGSGPFGGTAGIAQLCRVWFIDNWGEFMLACPQNGGIYQWQPSSGTATRATALTNAPAFNTCMMVSAATQQVIAGGSTVGGVQDPMLVAWSDVGNNTVWTASATNQAGTFRLTRGSRIVGMVGAGLTNLIWTNEGLWVMQYIGFPLVYSFVEVGFNCGLIAPKAAASVPNGVYWMDPAFNFWLYNGSTQPVDCWVRDQLFGNCNLLQVNKIFCAVDSNWNEIWWFYPSLNSVEIDSYVKFNYVENVWDYGTLQRTAWEPPITFPYPMATDANAVLYNHELGVDNNGAPMDSFAQTGYFADREGEEFMEVKRLFPDFKTWVGPLNASVLAIDYPDDNPRTFGPYAMIPGVTEHVITRVRGRGVALRIESNVLGGNYRWAGLRARTQPAGRRR